MQVPDSLNWKADDFQKSSYSKDEGQCVEVAFHPEAPIVAVRDSKQPFATGGIIAVPSTAWDAFRSGLLSNPA